MEEIEDEEVIFENSALHKVLQDCGVTAFETEARYSSSIFNNQSEKLTDEADEPVLDTSTNTTNRQFLEEYGLLTASLLPAETIHKLADEHRRKTLHRLSMSQLLSEEDKILLENLREEEPVPTNVKKTSKRQGFTVNFMYFLLFGAFTAGLISSLGLSYLTETISFIPFCQHLSDCHVLLVGMVTLACYLFLTCLLSLGKWWLTRQVILQLSKKEDQVCQFERKAVELRHLEKKCLRLIQESEMVARGFTIASQRHLASRLDSNSKGVSSSLWPELRKKIVSSNQDIMVKIGEAVANVVKSGGSSPICQFNPLGSLTDISSHYGQGEGFMEHTEGDILSPGRVKASVDLMGDVLSGFLCRLALCFHHDFWECCQTNPYNLTQEAVSSLNPLVQQLSSDLSKNYSFSRAFYTVSDNTAESSNDQSDSQAKEKCVKEIDGLYTCVNSLDLHLQSVMQRTRQLTLDLEERLDLEHLPRPLSSEGEAVSDQTRAEWEDRLKQVFSELETCLDCCKESLKNVRPLKAHSTSSPTDTAVESPATTNQSTQQASPVVHIPAKDPVIEDEVFEGETGSEMGDMGWERRPRYTDEDRMKMKQFREMANSLQSELRAVVKEKAKEHQAREAKALARARGHEDPIGSDEALIKSSETKEMINKTQDEVKKDFDKEDKDSGKTSLASDLDAAKSTHGHDLSFNNSDECIGIDRALSANLSVPDAQVKSFDMMKDRQAVTVLPSIATCDSESSIADSVPQTVPLNLQGDLVGESISQGSVTSCLTVIEMSRNSDSSSTISQESSLGGKNEVEGIGGETTSVSQSVSKESQSKTDLSSSSRLTQQSNNQDSDSRNNGVFLEPNCTGEESTDSFSPQTTQVESPPCINSQYPVVKPTSCSIGSSPTDPLNNQTSGMDNEQYTTDSQTSKADTEDTGTSKDSLMSQLTIPSTVDPEAEGFTLCSGGYHSRHWFTESDGDVRLMEGLKRLRKDTAVSDWSSVTASSHDLLRPIKDSRTFAKPLMPRRRQSKKAGLTSSAEEKYEEIDDSIWVKVSHRQFSTDSGAHYDLLRQKEVRVESLPSQEGKEFVYSSSGPSLTSSLAAMAAGRARMMNPTTNEEKFGDSSSSDEDTG